MVSVANSEGDKVSFALENQLNSYFRQLANHDLLTPEDEHNLAKSIEQAEIMTWRHVLSCTELIPDLFLLLDTTVKPPKTDRPEAIKKTATALRKVDLDRVLIDTALSAFSSGKLKIPKTFLKPAQQSHRDAAALRDKFVRANLRLVVTMARRYDRGGMPLADLIQEGNLGLIHAVSRFDYHRGLRFSTYACWWIRHAIGRALADKARAVRIPVHMVEAQQRLEKVRQRLVGELGRLPTLQELSKAARVPIAKLNQMQCYIMGQPMSLDRPIHDDDDRSFGDTMTDPDSEEHSPEDNMTTETLTSQIRRLLHHLSPIEADVLTKRFGLGDDEERTFREIGDQYHLSRERIRQIQNSALAKLKDALAREHDGDIDF